MIKAMLPIIPFYIRLCAKMSEVLLWVGIPLTAFIAALLLRSWLIARQPLKKLSSHIGYAAVSTCAVIGITSFILGYMLDFYYPALWLCFLTPLLSLFLLVLSAVIIIRKPLYFQKRLIAVWLLTLLPLLTTVVCLIETGFRPFV
jgi:hypothetical protein